MGQIHNELRRGAFSRALKNFLGSADSEAGVERFGETLTPIIDGFNLPELNFPRGDSRFGRLFQADGVIARFNGVQIFNPANSGIIAVVEFLENNVEMYGEVSIGDNSGVFANLQTDNGSPLDVRSKPAGPSSICVVHMGDAATSVIADPVYRFDANVGDNNRMRAVLPPNTQAFFLARVANSFLAAGFVWRERKANTEEL